MLDRERPPGRIAHGPVEGDEAGAGVDSQQEGGHVAVAHQDLGMGGDELVVEMREEARAAPASAHGQQALDAVVREHRVDVVGAALDALAPFTDGGGDLQLQTEPGQEIANQRDVVGREGNAAGIDESDEVAALEPRRPNDRAREGPPCARASPRARPRARCVGRRRRHRHPGDSGPEERATTGHADSSRSAREADPTVFKARPMPGQCDYGRPPRMNPRRERLGRLALLLASVRRGGADGRARPARRWVCAGAVQAPGELYSPRERLFLDCYPSNPRGYFDIDLRAAEVRRAYEARGVAGVDEVAARAPFAVEFRYNTLFFRERELAPKAAGVIRVVLLGDSFTEGQGVKEADTTARRLESLLNASGDRRWEVLNCARRGADFPSLHKMFEKILPYEPDVVVHAMVLNDPERSPAFEARRGPMDDWILDRRRLLTGPSSGRPRALSSRLADFVGDRVQAWRVGRETTGWYLDLYGAPNEEGWARTQDQMRDMDRRLRERGGRLLVASWPCSWTSTPIRSRPRTRPSPASARGAGIPRVDLRRALSRPHRRVPLGPSRRPPSQRGRAPPGRGGPVEAGPRTGAPVSAGVPSNRAVSPARPWAVPPRRGRTSCR